MTTPWAALPGPVHMHLQCATTHASTPPLSECACARRPTACTAVTASGVAAMPARWRPCLQPPSASGKCSRWTARLVQRHGRAAVQVLAAALKARVLQDAQLVDDVPRPRPFVRLGLPCRAARPSQAPWQAGVTARSWLRMPSLSQRLCQSAHARRNVTGGCQTPLRASRVHKTSIFECAEHHIPSYAAAFLGHASSHCPGSIGRFSLLSWLHGKHTSDTAMQTRRHRRAAGATCPGKTKRSPAAAPGGTRITRSSGAGPGSSRARARRGALFTQPACTSSSVQSSQRCAHHICSAQNQCITPL